MQWIGVVYKIPDSSVCQSRRGEINVSRFTYSSGGTPEAQRPLLEVLKVVILLEVLLKPGSPYCSVSCLLLSPVPCLLSPPQWLQVELRRIWAMQPPDLNRLQSCNNNCLQETEPKQLPARKTNLNNCLRETEPKRLPGRKSITFGARKSFTSARNESSTSEREKAAKPNGFFAPKREERRILSSLATHSPPLHSQPRASLFSLWSFCVSHRVSNSCAYTWRI
jgi:hypothetical protein